MRNPCTVAIFSEVLAALGVASTVGGRARAGANDRLDIGIIGTSGQAISNIKGVEGENIVAVCDIDANLLGKARERFPRRRGSRISAR